MAKQELKGGPWAAAGSTDTDLSFLSLLELYRTHVARRRVSSSRIVEPLDIVIAGELSLADLFLAPIVFYVSLTPDMAGLLPMDGLAAWWELIQAVESFKSTAPN